MSAREWNFDMEAAPRDGTIIEACARYPDATAGYPRFVGYCNDGWYEYSRHKPEPVIAWAWRPRTEWPDEQYDIARQPYTQGARE